MTNVRTTLSFSVRWDYEQNLVVIGCVQELQQRFANSRTLRVNGRFSELPIDQVWDPLSKDHQVISRRALNYDDIVDFDTIVAMCGRRGDEIQVGYDGGESALRSAVRSKGNEHVRERRWTVRYPSTNEGVIDAINWLSGARFLELMNGLHIR